MSDFKVGDRVICQYVGRETTSTHLQAGDKGRVKHVWAIVGSTCPTEYLVDFITSDGYRRQWVYAHSLALDTTGEKDLVDRIIKAESELGRLRNELDALYA